MKILHLINTLSAGGAELHLLALCRQTKQRNADMAVAFLRERVAGSRSLRADFEKNRIRLFDLRGDQRYDWRVLGRLTRLLRQERPDILHTHLPRADIAGAMVSRLVRPPVFVCSVHGIYRDRWFGSRAAPFMRQAYRRADAVIAISFAVKAWLHQELGVPGHKIRVIHYGIEPREVSSFKWSPAETGAGERPFTIGSLGRLEEGKGFDCLIRAMGHLRGRLPGATLSIAGHDPVGYGQTLEQLISRSNLRERVRLVGFQSDVASFLHRLDVFAFASRSEGFGQVIIEAMSARKPVVASRIPPLTEIIVDRETGLLVEPDNPQAFAEALTWLESHPEERLRLGESGHERVRRYFSLDRMSDRVWDLYHELLSQASSPKTLAS